LAAPYVVSSPAPRSPLHTPWLLSAENYFIVLARINWRNRLLPFLKLNWTATQLLCLWSRATTKAPLSYRAFAHALHTYSPGSPPPCPLPFPKRRYISPPISPDCWHPSYLWHALAYDPAWPREFIFYFLPALLQLLTAYSTSVGSRWLPAGVGEAFRSVLQFSQKKNIYQIEESGVSLSDLKLIMFKIIQFCMAKICCF